MPRADQTNGLVALASIVSKTVRELWMDVFNAYWLRANSRAAADGRISRSTQPGSAQAIEPVAAAEGHDPAHWWRIK